MAPAVKPLRLDGRRSAANVQVCGWGRPPVWHHQAVPMVAAPGRRLHHHPVENRFHAIEQQRGEFCATRSNAGTDGSEAFAVGAYQRGTTGREAGLRYSAGRAQRGRVVPLHL